MTDPGQPNDRAPNKAMPDALVKNEADPVPAKPASLTPAASGATGIKLPVKPFVGGRRKVVQPVVEEPPVIAVGQGRNAAFDASLEFFLSPLIPYLRDPTVSEIMVNGPDHIYVERAGQIDRTSARFATEIDVQAAANNIAQFVGQNISEERPIMDGRLPDGSRVCVILGKIASAGTCINIRRFGLNTATPQFLLEKEAITPMALEFLLLCVKMHLNILVTGGAGSGKTTLVNVLTTAFSDRERIVVIEDTRELQVQQEHVVQMEARPADVYGRGLVSVRDLFVAALRMRPDRIVVGEVRRGEALDLVQAMTSGHAGSLATLHASTPADACHRLETMALMADVGIPLFALRRQVASALDIIVQTSRLPSGRRMITDIAEVHFSETTQTYHIRDIFHIDELTAEDEKPMMRWTGEKPGVASQLRANKLVDTMEHTRAMVE